MLTLLQQTYQTKKTSPQGLRMYKGVTSFAGVMPYTVVDDSGDEQIASFLISPDEIFKRESLDTLLGVGVYIGHPSVEEAQDFNKAQGLVVGVEQKFEWGEDTATIAGEVSYLYLTLAIWGQDAIDFIDAGNKELSLGYFAKFEKTDGLWYGTPYQYRKTNITYDHLALTTIGTARNGNYSRIVDSKLLSDIAEIKTYDNISLILDTIKQEISLEEKKSMDFAEFESKVTAIIAENQKKMLDTIAPLLVKDATPEVIEVQVKPDMTKELQKSLAVLEKAKAFGIDPVALDFDIEKISAAAVAKAGFKVDGVNQETLNYVLENISPPQLEPIVEPPTTPTTSPNTPPIQDSRGAALKKSVVSNTVGNNYSSLDMAEKLAEKRARRAR